MRIFGFPWFIRDTPTRQVVSATSDQLSKLWRRFSAGSFTTNDTIELLRLSRRAIDNLNLAVTEIERLKQRMK